MAEKKYMDSGKKTGRIVDKDSSDLRCNPKIREGDADDMAIVENWAQPLEDVLQKKLNKNDSSFEELTSLETVVGVLYGTNPPEQLRDLLERRKQELPARYVSALKKAEKGQTKDTVEKGIRELEKLGGYEEAPQKIEAARKRLLQLQKRKKILIAVASAAVVMFFPIYTFIGSLSIKQTKEQLAQIQLQAEAGETAEALAALESLVEQKKINVQLYESASAVTAIILEKKAENEGFASALALFQDLKNTMPNTPDDGRFSDYAAAGLVNEDLPASERWAAFCVLQELDKAGIVPDFSYENIRDLLEACLNELSSELETGSGRDMKEWAESQSEALNDTLVDPNTALRFLYALNGAGYDVYELLPKGILLDLPVASKVTGLLNANGEDADDVVDMSTVLPVYIQEEDSYERKSIHEHSSFDNGSFGDYGLKKTISEMQANDDHYNVWLLTEYLFRIPEEMLPDSFDDCHSLLSMQTIYYHSGSIEHRSSQELSINEYYPFFTALDIVAVYDQGDPSRSECFYIEKHPAKVEDDAWFNSHKSNSSSLLSAENMLGEFDMETLKNKYNECIENIGLLRFYWMFDSGNAGEGGTNESE